MLYKLNNEQIRNLTVFLNRVKMKGIDEAIAMTAIIQSLQNPIKENIESEEDNKNND